MDRLEINGRRLGAHRLSLAFAYRTEMSRVMGYEWMRFIGRRWLVLRHEDGSMSGAGTAALVESPEPDW